MIYAIDTFSKTHPLYNLYLLSNSNSYHSKDNRNSNLKQQEKNLNLLALVGQTTFSNILVQTRTHLAFRLNFSLLKSNT